MHHPHLPAPTLPAGLRVGPMTALLAVDSIGSLVAQETFDARVHSVFEHACNLQADGLLLTICTPDRARGVTTLRLARTSPAASAIDLRRLFVAGERLQARDGHLRGGRTALSLAQAMVWHSPAPRCLLGADERAHKLRRAREGLARRSPRRGDSRHAAVAAALAESCRRADLAETRRHAAALVGCGEGLTPAGDDFLAGLLAGLDAMAAHSSARQATRDALAGVILASLGRTNAIAASSLRLAVQGHPGELLCALREALLCPAGEAALDVALAHLLAVGASSGAEMAAGLLAGIEGGGP